VSRSPLFFIFLTVLIDLIGFGIVLPLLPVYSEAYGASGTTLSLLFASFSGMQFLFAPMWGRLSDRIGRRPVLIGGLLGTSGSYLLFGFADSLEMLFVSRLLAGFFGANVSTAQAWIADVTKPSERAKGMGLVGAAFGLGFTLGPWIGGEMTSLSIGMPGFFAAGLSFAAATFGYFTLPEPARHAPAATRVFGLDQVRAVCSSGRLGVLFLLYFLAVFSFSAFEAMFTLFGLAVFPGVFGVERAIEHASREEILAAAPIVGRYMGFIGIMAALVQGGLIRRLVPRFGEVRLAVVGPALLGLAFLVIGAAPSWAFVLAGCALMPFGFGVNNPALNSLISRASPAERQGAFLGLNQSLASLARVLGPLTAGLLFDSVGPRSPFFASAAVLGLATLLAAGYRARHGASFVLETAPEGRPG
jgi:MFS family permease